MKPVANRCEPPDQQLSSPAALPAAALLVMLIICVSVGCNRGPRVAPVSGVVKFKGQPLKFGAVMTQPAQGQPARAMIQSDGSFVLSTFDEGDGAVVGTHKVRISCYEAQRDGMQAAEGEVSLGKLLIPRKYTLYDQSGLTLEVPNDGNDQVVFDLNDD